MPNVRLLCATRGPTRGQPATPDGRRPVETCTFRHGPGGLPRRVAATVDRTRSGQRPPGAMPGDALPSHGRRRSSIVSWVRRAQRTKPPVPTRHRNEARDAPRPSQQVVQQRIRAQAPPAPRQQPDEPPVPFAPPVRAPLQRASTPAKKARTPGETPDRRSSLTRSGSRSAAATRTSTPSRARQQSPPPPARTSSYSRPP